jgi:hypothetical protein
LCFSNGISLKILLHADFVSVRRFKRQTYRCFIGYFIGNESIYSYIKVRIVGAVVVVVVVAVAVWQQ